MQQLRHSSGRKRHGHEACPQREHRQAMQVMSLLGATRGQRTCLAGRFIVRHCILPARASPRSSGAILPYASPAHAPDTSHIVVVSGFLVEAQATSCGHGAGVSDGKRACGAAGAQPPWRQRVAAQVRTRAACEASTLPDM
jgi:hypothetical protein